MILESLNNWEMSAKIYYQRNIFINVKTCTYIIKIIIEKAGVVIISLFLNFSRVFEYASSHNCLQQGAVKPLRCFILPNNL